MTTNSKSDLFKLGLYQIIGGGVGILFLLSSLTSFSELSIIIILILLAGLILFSFSVFCGILCLKSFNTALRYSVINQFLQIVGFAVFGFFFKYVAGIFVSAGIDLFDGFKLTFNFGISEFQLFFNRENDHAGINLNFFALGIIYWIEKIKNKRKLESVFEDVKTVS